jgi:hypothetical protein
MGFAKLIFQVHQYIKPSASIGFNTKLNIPLSSIVGEEEIVAKAFMLFLCSIEK